MKHLKVAAGLGAACIVCCAVPISAGVASAAAASSAWMAYADELVPAAWAAAGVAVIAAGLWLWRRTMRSVEEASIACTLDAATMG